MCDRCELIKAPAKKVPDTNRQSEINQRKHTQIICSSGDNTGANPKRAVSSVKRVPKLFSTPASTCCSKNIRAAKLCIEQFPVATPFDSTDEFPVDSQPALRLDLVSPEELPHSQRIDHNGHNEKENLVHRYFGRAVACKQKKHPRKQNHRVPI